MRVTAPSGCLHDCPSQCAIEGTTEAGRITGVAGDPRHPFTRGVISGKVHVYAERVYGSTRVQRLEPAP
jgi:anaerobic selenocysteine-containing dehydrogenase